MACQNHTREMFDFVSTGKTALLPVRAEKRHGRSFSEYV